MMKALVKQQENSLRQDIREIRNDLRPENIFWNVFSSLTGVRMNKTDFFKNGIAYGLSLILQRFVLKTEKKMENKVYDFVDSIFERLKNKVNKFAGSEAKRKERKETSPKPKFASTTILPGCPSLGSQVNITPK